MTEFPEHRTPERIKRDLEHDVPQTHIDAYNRGYEFHVEAYRRFQTPTLAWFLSQSPYSMLDYSPEGTQFWDGFEKATMDRMLEKIVTKAGGYDPVAEAEEFLWDE